MLQKCSSKFWIQPNNEARKKIKILWSLRIKSHHMPYISHFHVKYQTIYRKLMGEDRAIQRKWIVIVTLLVCLSDHAPMHICMLHARSTTNLLLMLEPIYGMWEMYLLMTNDNLIFHAIASVTFSIYTHTKMKFLLYSCTYKSRWANVSIFLWCGCKK